MTSINGRDMVLLISAVDRSNECTVATLGYGTRQTFADMRGTKPKVINMTIKQELDATSLYRIAMSGNTASLAAILKPLGNAAASVTQPHYTFDVTPSGISGDAFMGGEAAEDASEALTVDVSWIISNWTEDTTP